MLRVNGVGQAPLRCRLRSPLARTRALTAPAAARRLGKRPRLIKRVPDVAEFDAAGPGARCAPRLQLLPQLCSVAARTAASFRPLTPPTTRQVALELCSMYSELACCTAEVRGRPFVAASRLNRPAPPAPAVQEDQALKHEFDTAYSAIYNKGCPGCLMSLVR